MTRAWRYSGESVSIFWRQCVDVGAKVWQYYSESVAI